MAELVRYEIYYTETAIADIEEKAAYISQVFRDPALAMSWYTRVRDAIQEDLSFFPLKYPLYQVSPWREKGIRLFLLRNDVILYSVHEAEQRVYIRSVCTNGRDLSAHLQNTEQ